MQVQSLVSWLKIPHVVQPKKKKIENLASYVFFIYVYICVYIYISNLYIYLFGAVLGLVAVQAFLYLWLVGLLSSCSVWALHCDGFSCCRVEALEHRPNRFSCSLACGIFLNQGSNPCLLHQQTNSLPLSHLGNPYYVFSTTRYPPFKAQVIPDRRIFFVVVVVWVLSTEFAF